MESSIISRLEAFATRTAVEDASGLHTYAELLARARGIAVALGGQDLNETRIAVLTDPGADFAAALLGIWMVGGIAIPLCRDHPAPEISYVLEDSGAIRVIADQAHASRFRHITLCLEGLPKDAPQFQPCVVAPDRRALMLYTSGTTGRSKGVVTTHAQVEAMICPLVSAWGWSERDHILHVLPLHHAHGLVNALLCCLWSGATCLMLPRFVACDVWDRLGQVTLFMGVPTMYRRLLEVWEQAGSRQRSKWSTGCSSVRLMVSGSSALPADIFVRWEKVTGHRLLERYGMTEIGMALSNPLTGERRPGTVGVPLPGVEVRLVDELGQVVDSEGQAGELQVKSPSVFQEYWRRPEATEVSFQRGWFSTGDVATVEHGYYRILGRKSVDIIKTGGYKVSALEIENVLRSHAAVADCAIVGVVDEDWGEAVCAAVVPNPGFTLTLDTLRLWAKGQLAYYKVPTRIRILNALPLNSTGKVQKVALRAAFEAPQAR